MIKTIGFGATKFHKTLQPKIFQRQEPGNSDVEMELLYCGVCHSDVHQVNDDWKNTVWPCVPGHEIVGKVSRIGQNVTTFKVGDLAAVGCITDSCGTCYSCRHGDEQFCEAESGMLGTYNGPLIATGQNTYGGYSNHFVIKENYLIALPEGMPPEVAGPILCAGVTTYSPLKHWGVKPGMRVGIVGMGGLGHMAVKIAKAMGADVTVITTSSDKKEDAMKFGASKVVLSTSKKEMAEVEKSLDLILNTIPERHEIEPYLNLLHHDGAMVIVGVLMTQPEWNPQQIIMYRRTLAGSLIGGIAETKEVLDFCVQHQIFPEIEMIEAHEINDAFKNIESKKARYRYVIDLSTLGKEDVSKLEDIGVVGHILLKDKKAKTPQPEVQAEDNRLNFEPSWSQESEHQ
ncbi:MAG: NAD(P)-dependent alcohol dehydrogenase [Bacteriovorax sp.]|nr:NAD(P)-dependent alcohol dehydrogenase [Bacteriovorax sp.]